MSEWQGFNAIAQNKAKSYLYTGLAVSFVKGVVLVFLGFVTLIFHVSSGLETAIAAYVSDQPLIVALFTLVGFAAFWLVSLPFDYYKGYVVENRFDLSKESEKKWFVDHLKASTLSGLAILVFVQGIFGFMRVDIAYWWLYLWAATVLVAVFFLYVSPVLIMPLFYKFPKLENEELLSRLTKLAGKAGIKIIGVFEMKAGEKTKKATAALTGIGGTRRMLLSDTFLTNFSDDETESVMGHEIGHHVFGHLWKFTFELSLMVLVMLFITSVVLPPASAIFSFDRFYSVATLPLIALIFGLMYFAFTPIMNTLSRRAEGNCDQYELELADKPDAYISSMTKLCDQNLRYATPPAIIEFLFYDHPSGKKRIDRALEYKRRKLTQ